MLNRRRYGVGCRDLACKCANIWILGLVDVHIYQVQTLDTCVCLAKQRSCQALDCVAVSDKVLRVALDWSPRLACHVDIVNHDSILVERCSFACKLLQACLVVNNKEIGVCLVCDGVRKLTHIARNKRLGVARLNCCIHYTTRVLVDGNIELVVLARRNCKVEVVRSARKYHTRIAVSRLLESAVDSVLCIFGWSQLARCKVQLELACDRLAINGRDLHS